MIERVPVLTIAGSDSIGGAGIQADLKTMTMLRVYGMSAITALTAQNTVGVADILPVSPKFLQKQLQAICSDVTPKAVKIGMIADAEQVSVICTILKAYQISSIVIDPVMVATTGATLTQKETVHVMIRQLFPMATLITPNLQEATALMGKPVQTLEDMKLAAEQLSNQYGVAVLIKGGHLEETSTDVLYDGVQAKLLTGTRIPTQNTHGTGCTLSSAIASELAKGTSLWNSIQTAKAYVAECIGAGLQLGCGNGPICHNYE